MRATVALGLSVVAAVLAIAAAVHALVVPGLYRPFVPPAFLPGAFGQDVVSLVAGLALLGSVRALTKGSERAWLAWLGLLAFLFYAHAVYAFDRVYTVHFLTYVAVAGLAAWAAVIVLARAEPRALAASRAEPLPRRTTAAWLLALAAVFAGLWLGQVVLAIRHQRPPDGNAVLVLDLAFFLPLLAIEAALLLRRRPLGDALAVPVLVLSGLVGWSVLLGALAARLYDRPLDVGGVAGYAALAFVSTALAARFLRRPGGTATAPVGPG